MIKEFITFLRIERGFSKNSILAYKQDVSKLLDYLGDKNLDIKNVVYSDLENFINFLVEIQIQPRTLARIISGIKSFFKFLELEKYIEVDVSELLETPKITKKLPDILSLEEIDKIISVIDLTKPEGERNKTILEVLYGCGIRVSELINLSISDLFFEEGFIKILGKGKKERFIPISEYTQKYIDIYIKNARNSLKIKKGDEDILFLNRRGSRLSRMMIFLIIKELTDLAGINKSISPHTFRHSFATHLLYGGASIISIQQMLGHESITTTEIYVHISQKRLRDEMVKFHPRGKKI